MHCFLRQDLFADRFHWEPDFLLRWRFENKRDLYRELLLTFHMLCKKVDLVLDLSTRSLHFTCVRFPRSYYSESFTILSAEEPLIDIFYIPISLMEPSTRHLRFRQVRGNSSFIIHSKLLDFYIFPQWSSQALLFIQYDLFKSNNSYTLVDNAYWEKFAFN